MSVRSRQTKVFVALLVSITAGAIILKALGNNPPSAGAFCLSRYYRLDPVEKIILSRATQYPGRWSHIEIYYSGTGASTKSDEGEYDLGLHRRPDNTTMYGSNKRIPETQRASRCHFVVCNGSIGYDGQILPNEIWQRQCPPQQLHQWGQSQTGRSEQTIYICVIADDKVAHPTDFQIKRTEALVEGLSRKFNIRPESIHYPDNWQ